MPTSETRVVATRSIVPALTDGSVNVYAEKKKVFSLWEDFSDGPVFIYPFADNRRFLCDYNFDTAILVFVVDLDGAGTNGIGSTDWPPNDEPRSYLARNATNVVSVTMGAVRLPTFAELREVSDYVSQASVSQIERASMPYCDFGIYRHYVSKEFLLLDLATNRQSYWPL